jgi:RHS repeat-associated protein
MAATYKYDPYGRTLSSSGTLASANVYRFSSKEIHPNSGFYYYGFRFYDPNTQRWLNRDPIGDMASASFQTLVGTLGNAPAAEAFVEGPNLYSLAANSPLAHVDGLGLSCGANTPWYVPGSDAQVPDDPIGFDFSGACARHDACYATCGTGKHECDRQFLSDMRYACRRSGALSPALCYLVAYTYYQAVNWGGGAAYREAQRQACPCMVVPKDSPPVIVSPGTRVIFL